MVNDTTYFLSWGFVYWFYHFQKNKMGPLIRNNLDKENESINLRQIHGLLALYYALKWFTNLLSPLDIYN